MRNYRGLLDALQRSDIVAVKMYAQDPDIDLRVKGYLNTWLRHNRGREVAYLELTQHLHSHA
jgi:hypothetical protein